MSCVWYFIVVKFVNPISQLWKTYQFKNIILIGGAWELNYIKCKSSILHLSYMCSDRKKMLYVTFQIYLKALPVMKTDMNTLWLFYHAIQFTVTTVNSQGLLKFTMEYTCKSIGRSIIFLVHMVVVVNQGKWN